MNNNVKRSWLFVLSLPFGLAKDKGIVHSGRPVSNMLHFHNVIRHFHIGSKRDCSTDVDGSTVPRLHEGIVLPSAVVDCSHKCKNKT